MRSLLLSLGLLLGLAAPLFPRVQATAVASLAEDDGPYVLWEGREAKVLRILQGRVEEARLRKPWILALPGGGTLALRPEAPAPVRVQEPAPARIAALSDVHGNLDGMKALLRAQKVVDPRGAWSFGKGHLVVVGDVMDRGSQCIEAYWYLRGLQAQAAKAGGRVHVLLGNHEMMVLGGQLRYVNPKYARSGALLGCDLRGLLGPDTELGRWLRACPGMLKLGDTLFVHGGPSPALLREGRDLETLNAALRRALDVRDDASRAFVGAEGPLWYRGLLPGALPGRPEATEAEVEELLRAFGVSRIVVGHTTLKTVTPFHGGRVIGIDAGLKDGRPGELLLLEKARTRRGLADGRCLALEPSPTPFAD